MGVGHSGWRENVWLKVLNYYNWIFGVINMSTYIQIELILNSIHSHIFNSFFLFVCSFRFSGQSRKAGAGDPLQRRFDLEILPTGAEQRAAFYTAPSSSNSQMLVLGHDRARCPKISWRTLIIKIKHNKITCSTLIWRE